MGWVVKITSGTTRTQSIPLKNKLAVTNYVKRSPVGRWNTPIKVLNTKSNKEISNIKVHFQRLKW